MSSYATVYMSDGRSVCAFRNGVDQLFFLLFTRNDWIELEGPDAWRLVNDTYGIDESDARVVGFRSTVGVLRDRLDVLGITLTVVSSTLLFLARERARMLDEFEVGAALDAAVQDEWNKEIEFLRSLTWESWLSQIQKGLEAGMPVTRWGGREPLGTPSRLMSLWEDHDPRYQLRALLEALPAEEEITLDLADLADGGWIDTSVDPRDEAEALVSYTSQGGLLPIVLTEGRYDVEVLSAALRLRRPHLAEYIKFPDFNVRNEGGASALRQTVRAFASAGIPNRVVALFDNDTAARDVLRSISDDDLPGNIRVTRLPELPLAVDYPTVGPQGEHTMNVNGLATAIELFLGADVLADGGALRPVVWGGYVNSMGAYQGEVSEKDAIHDRFAEKVRRASQTPDEMDDQDWTGLDLILDHLIGVLRDVVLPSGSPING